MEDNMAKRQILDLLRNLIPNFFESNTVYKGEKNKKNYAVTC